VMNQLGRSTALASAAALDHEARGQLPEAIAAWTDLNRRQRDSEVERRLVRLRHEAAHQLDRLTPADSWPRVMPDPFPHVVGKPPEISHGELTPELLGGAILHHGCLLVRGLMPTPTAADLVLGIDAAFDARQASVDDSPPSSPRSDAESWFVPDDALYAKSPTALIVRKYSRGLNALHACDSPRVLFSVIDALERTRVPQVIGDHFGETAVLTADKCMLRRIQPEPMPQPGWHQDGSFMGTVRSVDVWVALTPCGGDSNAPGLEILPRRLRGVLECGKGVARNPIEVVDEEVARAGGDVAPLCPTFESGDALLFDDLFLHRTTPGGAHERYALEAWFFAASCRPEKYAPFVL